MSLKDFKTYFSRVQICRLNDDYKYAFLKARKTARTAGPGRGAKPRNRHQKPTTRWGSQVARAGNSATSARVANWTRMKGTTPLQT